MVHVDVLAPRQRAQDLVLLQRRWSRNLVLAPRQQAQCFDPILRHPVALWNWSSRRRHSTLTRIAETSCRRSSQATQVDSTFVQIWRVEVRIQNVIVNYDDVELALR